MAHSCSLNKCEYIYLNIVTGIHLKTLTVKVVGVGDCGGGGCAYARAGISIYKLNLSSYISKLNICMSIKEKDQRTSLKTTSLFFK